MSKRRQTVAAQERAGRAEEEAVDLRRQVYDLGVELEREIDEIERLEMAALVDVETVQVGLDRDDLRVDQFVVLWVPLSRPI